MIEVATKLSEHDARLAGHEDKFDGVDGSIALLWKQKVSLERYIWVERFVIGACGAIAMYAWQHLAK